MSLKSRAEVIRSQEAAYVDHYDLMMKWALQLTDRQQGYAQDLIQDVFVQLMSTQTDLSTVRNIDAYLYTCLRNNWVSKMRLASRTLDQHATVIVPEIGDVTTGRTDPSTLFQDQERLWLVCEYACRRKQSSCAGSVLILRYFHDYSVSEIAKILGSTCSAVRQNLRFARIEARVFAYDHYAINFVGQNRVRLRRFGGHVCPAGELTLELRRMIFQSCRGPCLTRQSVACLSLKRRAVMADKFMLAHIVSCSSCLDEVNRKLELPLLARRYPDGGLELNRLAG